MKHYIYMLLMAAMPLLLTSCLKSGLDDIDNSDQCNITSLTMECRWIEPNANGYDQMSRQPMTLKYMTNEFYEIHFTIEVPSGGTNFPFLVRDQVELDGLYMIAVISSSAKIEPLGDAPRLGYPGHWEVGTEYRYKVTAANGNYNIYTIVIDDFVKN